MGAYADPTSGTLAMTAGARLLRAWMSARPQKPRPHWLVICLSAHIEPKPRRRPLFASRCCGFRLASRTFPFWEKGLCRVPDTSCEARKRVVARGERPQAAEVWLALVTATDRAHPLGGRPLGGFPRPSRRGRPASFYPPTLFDHVGRGSLLSREEVFGPVAGVFRVRLRSSDIAVPSETNGPGSPRSGALGRPRRRVGNRSRPNRFLR